MSQNEKKYGLTPYLLVGFFGFVMVLTVAGFALTRRPPVATEHGRGVDTVINYLLLSTGAIFIVGQTVLMGFVLKFGRGGGGRYAEASRRIEWTWAIVPAVTLAVVSEVGVLFLGLPVWGQLYGEPEGEVVSVEITGKQFNWIIRYAGLDGERGLLNPERIRDSDPLGLEKFSISPAGRDDVVFVGVLYLPVGRMAQVDIRSIDVLHSFTVPEFRIKQDAVPGYTTRAQFVPTVVGRYEIGCAELCGLGHYRMRAFAEVLEAEEFDEAFAMKKRDVLDWHQKFQKSRSQNESEE